MLSAAGCVQPSQLVLPNWYVCGNREMDNYSSRWVALGKSQRCCQSTNSTGLVGTNRIPICPLLPARETRFSLAGDSIRGPQHGGKSQTDGELYVERGGTTLPLPSRAYVSYKPEPVVTRCRGTQHARHVVANMGYIVYRMI